MAKCGEKITSIEDAHRPNDLSLLKITARLSKALEHIGPHRLIAAPDCGLGLLDRRIVVAKLTNMVAAARAVA